MFKKSSENVHYLKRTGSHSTKGSGRGVDYIAPLAGDDFMSPINIMQRRIEIKNLRAEMKVLAKLFADSNSIFHDAVVNRDHYTCQKIAPTLKRMIRNMRAMRKKLSDLRATVPFDLPAAMDRQRKREQRIEAKKAERRAMSKEERTAAKENRRILRARLSAAKQSLTE